MDEWFLELLQAETRMAIDIAAFGYVTENLVRQYQNAMIAMINRGYDLRIRRKQVIRDYHRYAAERIEAGGGVSK